MTQVQAVDAGRDTRGGYKVDVGRGERVGRVSSEWFARPDDERYVSLSDLMASVQGRAERSRTRTVETAAIRTAFQNDNSGRDISIILASVDGNLLSATVARLEAEMRAIPGLANVQSDEPLPRPEVRITPRFAEAARAGVSTLAIGTLARIATEGETDGNSAKFNLGDRLIPIRVKLPAAAQGNLDTLAMLRVATDQGSTLPLIAVADIEVAEGTGFLNRFDRRRRITLNADLDGIPLGDALAAIAALPTMTDLPAGVREVRYGEAAYIDEMYASFGTAMAFGILMVFVVLIVLFRSFLQPITILVSLPLSIGGAIGGLLLYGGALDLPAVIGLLMLMGIVTKNSILLVEFAIEKLREGMDRRMALIEPPRVYRRAKLSENCPLWNRHQRRRPRSRISLSSVNVRCGWRWNTAMSISLRLRR